MGMLDTGMAVLTDSGGTRPGWRFVAALEVLSAIGFVAFFMRKGAEFDKHNEWRVERNVRRFPRSGDECKRSLCSCVRSPCTSSALATSYISSWPKRANISSARA